MCTGVGVGPTVWDSEYLWHKVLYTAHSFAYMAVYDLEIKLYSLVFFDAFRFCMNFVFLGYITSRK